MTVLVIVLAILSFTLSIVLSKAYSKNAKLSSENNLMKGRIEEMGKVIASWPSSEDKPLTIEGIADAVRHLGFTPECIESNVVFYINEVCFYINASNLPGLLINHLANINSEKWNFDLLRRVAHLVSDELVMVKAHILEDQDSNIIRFSVAAMDRNANSLKYNLSSYLGFINDAVDRFIELYQDMVNEQDSAADGLNPLTETIKSKDSVAS